ncbi:MAG: DUF1549 domain-containing protein [Verrucomicrobiaceae bacterium]|nr:DUF1549 domain-containing protein [Verrucomicrobiaceae bacterium]
MTTRTFKTLLFALSGGLVLTMASVSSVQAEMRTWTSADGKTLQADFVGTAGAGANAVVKLKLADGSVTSYPIAKLSEADRLFVKGNLPTDPAALAAEIDKLVLNKLKESYYGLRDELAALPQKTDLTADEKVKRKEEIEKEMQMCIPNEMTTDNQFLRRIYLDIAGRIPTFDEAEAFLNERAPDKRAILINDLLDSEGFVMRMYTYYADILRIREGITMMGNGDLKVDPYMEFIKQSIREDKPYDALVRELLTAKGKVWENPAVGYLISDQGMRLCNLSNTFTIFMGTEITCAQCHDHPFEEVYQMDFYKMAAFMGTTDTRARGGNAMMMMGSGDYRAEIDRMNKVLFDAGKLRPNQTVDQNLGQWFGTHRTQVVELENNVVKLPHDYKYDDGEPEMKVQPGTYFGDKTDLSQHESPREAFAEWVVSPGNPRFTINVVNRFWKIAFGLAQIEPVYNIPGHLDGQAQNYELLTFLEEMMKDLDFSVKDFFRVIYNTKAYQREAETLTPSLTQVDKGTYHFPGPILRRMTAEQIWDSLVALTTADPESVIRRGAEEYRQVMNVDPASLQTAEQILQWKEDFRNVSKLQKYSGEIVSREDTVDGVQMFRASELRQPMRPDHFLRMFGQSDKQLIENQFTTGSAPQVMALLNGTITNAVLTSPDAYLIKEIAFGKGSKRDNIDKIFLSVLSRYPTSEEKSVAQSGMRARTDRDMSEAQKLEAEALAIGNVIWALVNTREFMFIQ